MNQFPVAKQTYTGNNTNIFQILNDDWKVKKMTNMLEQYDQRQTGHHRPELYLSP